MEDEKRGAGTVQAEVDALADRVVAKIRALRVLNAGWEGGLIRVPHDGAMLAVTLGRVGGMGVVIPELPGALERYARARGLNGPWTMSRRCSAT
ncbi:MAG: hypothetical protein M5R40_15630 [Anaerolineae bacterium]|nr:hypothetical protein [Anaerolineae bacterium]